MKKEIVHVILTDIILLVLTCFAFVFLIKPLRNLDLPGIYNVLAVFIFIGVILKLIGRLLMKWANYSDEKRKR
jgi:uncharacterized membrane protein YhaH (DUF805 family)